MLTYDVQCDKCGLIKEVYCSYSERNNMFPCYCGGFAKKIPSNFALGAGMYNQPTKKYSSKREDQMAELRELGIEKISASTQNFDDTFNDLKRNSSMVREQMLAGEEKQKKNLDEKVKASKPSASEIKRLERIYEKKNIVPYGTKRKTPR